MKRRVGNGATDLSGPPDLQVYRKGRAANKHLSRTFPLFSEQSHPHCLRSPGVPVRRPEVKGRRLVEAYEFESNRFRTLLASRCGLQVNQPQTHAVRS